VFALLSIFCLCTSAESDPFREVRFQAERLDHQVVPAFYKGYIYWVGPKGPDNQVLIFAPDGLLAFRFETQHGTVGSVAVDSDGRLAVAWKSEHGGGIDLRDSSAALTKTIETGRYLPAHLSFAEDHSLWSLGMQRDAADPERPAKDYQMVRRYLPDGTEAGAYLPRSLFPPRSYPLGLEPAMWWWQRSSSIVAAHDRVGLWIYSGDNDIETEWVELDLNGNLLGRWPLDPFYRNTRMAFTTDGRVFVQYFDPEAEANRLCTLDRASSAWEPVKSPPSGYLEGADGDALVFSDFGFGPLHLRWYQHP
jgi:hypothetical protein